MLRELLLRRRIDFVLVAAPPSMTLQWQDELEAKFGLSFADHRPRAPGRPAPPARVRRQSLGHRLALHHLAPPADRRDLRRRPARHPGRVPAARPADPGRGAPRGARERRALCHRQPVHEGGARARRGASSIGCSCRPRRTTATPTASRRCWRSSTRSASPAACRSSPTELEPIMVRRLKDDLRAARRELPRAHRRADRDRRPAADAPELRLARMLVATTRTCASDGRAAAAGRSGAGQAGVLGPAAAAAVVGRGVRQDPRASIARTLERLAADAEQASMPRPVPPRPLPQPRSSRGRRAAARAKTRARDAAGRPTKRPPRSRPPLLGAPGAERMRCAPSWRRSTRCWRSRERAQARAGCPGSLA